MESLKSLLAGLQPYGGPILIWLQDNWIGALAVAIPVGLFVNWLSSKWFSSDKPTKFTHKSHSGNVQHTENMAQGDQSNTHVTDHSTAQGDITHNGDRINGDKVVVNNTFSAETIDEVKKAGLAEAAIHNFSKRLDIQQVPPYEWDAMLREFAERYLRLQAELDQLKTNDAEVGALKEKAQAFMAEGQWVEADAALQEAKTLACVTALKQKQQADEGLRTAAQLAKAQANARLSQLDYAGALDALQEAVELMPPGRDREWELERADLLFALGRATGEMGNFAGSENYHIKSMELRNKYDASINEKVKSILSLASSVEHQGRVTDSEKLYLQGIELLNISENADKNLLSIATANLAGLYSDQGDFVQAEKLFIKSLEITKSLPHKNPSDLGRIMNNIAQMYIVQERLPEAESILQSIVNEFEVTKNLMHPTFGIVLSNLASVHKLQGNFKAARALYERDLEIVANAYGRAHPGYAKTLNNMGSLCWEEKEFQEAESFFQQSIEIYENLLGHEHPDLAMSLQNLGGVYFSQKKENHGEALIKRASEIMLAKLPESPNTATVLKNHAQVLDALNRPQEAQQQRDLAAEVMRRHEARNAEKTTPTVAEATE
ncbi:tetratricopeptide repeat protein [Magnetofaba australis]|uniref:tetratricopeptide repeat protein n=1 Tax=Magnetofaba australis TaxID=1472297 RepID=UPI001301E28E|nr:tetratricopeptide repeat protein [Magnetofaba australis]